MGDSRWRKVASPIIARVLAETCGQAEREIRAALRDAYPFGERRYHPYKIWLDEIAKQRGGKKKVATKQSLLDRIAEIEAHNAKTDDDAR